MSNRTLAAFLLTLSAPLALAACASDTETNDQPVPAENGTADELRVRGQAAWFYSGPLPALEDPSVTISLKGHTARVRGYIPNGKPIPGAPHLRASHDGSRFLVDIVYPIATGASYSAAVGTYTLERAIPYRPDGNTWTNSAGNHWVTWGGFPFIGYNGTIAMHGPITPTVSGDRSMEVWYLRRGKVSSGCNRMMGEHVTELAHVLGINMRKFYGNKQTITPPRHTVTLIDDYDQIDGRWVDVDYPTDVGVVRPATVYGAENVEMFGSWVGSELPDGSDLPASMAWEGGVAGKRYVFQEHATYDWVCSLLPEEQTKLKAWANTRPGKTLPDDFCAQKACLLNVMEWGEDPAICGGGGLY